MAEGKDSCSGDSGELIEPQIGISSNCNLKFLAILKTGGPLVTEELRENRDPFSYLVGVVSFGPRVWFVLFSIFLCVKNTKYN